MDTKQNFGFFLLAIFLHFIVAIVLCMVLTFASLELLSLYTRAGAGSAVTVPNLVGLPVSIVAEYEDELPIAFQIIDSVYQPNKKPGEIIRQYPTATYIDPVTGQLEKRSVKEQKIMSLVINRFSPPLIELKPYYARPVKEVRLVLQEMGLKIAQENKIQVQVCPDCIVKITDIKGNLLEAGSKIKEGTAVVLWVDNSGVKEKQTVELPFLVGLTIAQAQEILKKNQLNLGNITTTTAQALYSENSVIQNQTPHPKQRTRVTIGTYINIHVAD